jgi:hypothetical protein
VSTLQPRALRCCRSLLGEVSTPQSPRLLKPKLPPIRQPLDDLSRQGDQPVRGTKVEALKELEFWVQMRLELMVDAHRSVDIVIEEAPSVTQAAPAPTQQPFS